MSKVIKNPIDGSWRVTGDAEDAIAVDAKSESGGVVSTLRGVGAKAGSGVEVTESVFGPYHETVFTFTDAAVTIADAAGTVAYGGLKIYDFPQALTNILTCVSDVDLTKSSAGINDNWDGDFGIGTVTASNNATLSSTEQNILPTTATPQAVSGATTANGVNTAAVVLDGTSTASDVYFNILVDDADHDVTSTPCNIILNGTVRMVWINGGDK